MVYTSARKPICTDEEIAKILDSSKKNNPKINLSGLLIHSDKRFLQYIEGSKKDLEELFETIKSDKRHGGVNLRCFEPIEKRVFPSWEMGYKDLSNADISFHTLATAKDKTTINELIENKIDFSDRGMKVLKLFLEVS